MVKINLRLIVKLIIGSFGAVLILGGLKELFYFNPYISILIGFFVIILSKVI